MPYLERTRRVGRSQAASIFWGLVSVFFAAAACYYFWQNHENEVNANVFRDEVLTLQEERESLNSEKVKLQASISDTEAQLKQREDFLQDKESKLADEANRLESLGGDSQTQSQQGQAQAAVIKRFNDTVRKLAKSGDTDVVVREGRPVLRVPNAALFAFGESTLKPEGKVLLTQLAAALTGQLTDFELHIETFTDPDGENAALTPVSLTPNDDAPTAGPSAGTNAAPEPDKVRPSSGASWVLTGARAAAIARYLRERTSLPFQNVAVLPRADSQPLISTGKESHARNRRTEFTIVPQAPPFRSTDLTTGALGESAGTSVASGKGKGNSKSPRALPAYDGNP